jgi:hypothetical protein
MSGDRPLTEMSSLEDLSSAMPPLEFLGPRDGDELENDLTGSGPISLVVPARMRRRGNEMKLIVEAGRSPKNPESMKPSSE